jgi:homoserine O-acetyltransferase
VSPEYASTPLNATANGGSGVHEARVALPSPWRMYHGDSLPQAHVAFRLIGPAGAPVVAALGGISAHRVVAGEKGVGWWCEGVGPGGAIDTDRYRVLGIDYIGGSGESTSPDGSGEFPPVSAFDQAEALRRVIDFLGLPSLHAIVGASYGGMVALSFAARHPACVGRLVVLSATDRTPPLSTAWRAVQRQIVREALARGDGPAGLRLARALAMTTYRSAAEFEQRFSAVPVRAGNRYRFPVEDYLFARGDHYALQYRAESFLALSESIDLHDMDAAAVRTPATVVAVLEDQLAPIHAMRAFAGRLGNLRRLVEISSIFGHDAFLKEGGALLPIIQSALAEGAA